jgi:hypothetical protein
MPSKQASQEMYSLTSAQEAYRLAQAIDRARDKAQRNKALAAILARLEQARRDNADRYLAQRLRRETSHDLS